MATDAEKARHNARRRAAKKAKKADVSDEIAMIYEKPLDQWDDEEIVRGRPRASDGTFRGNRPQWLTPTLQAERQRRLRQLMADEMGTFAADGLRIIHEIVKEKGVGEDGKPRVPASVRLDAAKYLVDQVMGKAKVSVDVHQDNTLADLMGAVLLNPDGKLSHGGFVVDGEVLDAEDSPSRVPDGGDDA